MARDGSIKACGRHPLKALRRALPAFAFSVALAFLAGCDSGEPQPSNPGAAVDATAEPPAVASPPPATEPAPEPAPAAADPLPLAVPDPAPAANLVPETPPPPEPPAAEAPPPEPEPEPAPPAPDLAALVAAADAAAGAATADICRVCHTLGQGEANGVGPNLFGIAGARVGAVAGFAYSPALRALFADEATWTLERLDAFLRDPGAAIPGTAMGFAGVAGPEQRLDLLAYLLTLTPTLPPPDRDPIVMTQAQVAAGQLLYRAHCIDCHGPTLRGVVDVREDALGEGPGIASPVFAARWFGGAVLDLYGAVGAMPPANPRLLSEADVANLVAYVLSVNGFETGATDLPTDEAILARMGYFQ